MNMQKAREAAGLKQRKAAKALGVDPPTLSNWEREKSLPPLPKFKELCRLYKAHPKSLYDPETMDFKGFCNPRSSDRHAPATRVSFRIPLDLVKNKEELQRMVDVCGYESVSSWLRHCIRLLQKQCERRTAGREDDDMLKGRTKEA